jgi:hypothetical protein
LSGALYLHDEPEIGLHPSSVRCLREELVKMSETNLVAFSTHSIFMIDREVIGRHLIVEKRNEVTKVRVADESNVDEEVLYNALGYSIFENLKKFNIVFEGWRDKQLFAVAVASLPPSHATLQSMLESMGICHAKGVKDIGRIAPMLELARRDWIVVSDADKPAIEQQKKYVGTGRWLRYDQLGAPSAVTAEDFIRAGALVAVLRVLKLEEPRLASVELPLLESTGRLGTIRSWLLQAGIGDVETNEILNRIKTALFDDLKAQSIEESYYNVLASIGIALGAISTS